jgi:hypothetical protein
MRFPFLASKTLSQIVLLRLQTKCTAFCTGLAAKFAYTIRDALRPGFTLIVRLVLGALLLVLQCALIRAVSRWYALGYSAVVVASLIFIVVGHSSLWNEIAGAVVRRCNSQGLARVRVALMRADHDDMNRRLHLKPPAALKF